MTREDDAMKMNARLAAFTLALLTASRPVPAPDLVLDEGVLAQATIMVDKAGEQIQRLNQQLDQLNNITQFAETNTRLDAFNKGLILGQKAGGVFDQAWSTFDRIKGLKEQFGSLDAFAQRFKDAGGYMESPCFQREACSPAQRDGVENTRIEASEAVKKANDAQLKSIEDQQQQIERESRKLDQLVDSAAKSDGQQEALQVANMIATLQSQQLMQLRQLLMAQYQADLARRQQEANREAQWEAEHRRVTANHVQLAAPREWRP
jgi:P-type conjugative transfer protein TrbJ